MGDCIRYEKRLDTYTTSKHTQHPLVQVHDRVIVSLHRMNGLIIVDPHKQVIPECFCPFQELDMTNVEQIKTTVHVDDLVVRARFAAFGELH